MVIVDIAIELCGDVGGRMVYSHQKNRIFFFLHCYRYGQRVNHVGWLVGFSPEFGVIVSKKAIKHQVVLLLLLQL